MTRILRPFSRRASMLLVAVLIASLLLLPDFAAALSEEKSNELQQIIDSAEPGSTVVLPAGEHNGPIVIDKPLRLASDGTAPVIIVNESEEPAVRIAAGDVSLEGLTIEDVRMKEQPAVMVTGDNAMLSKLRIRTGSYGILIRDADDGVVQDTAIEWAGEAAGRTIKLSEKGNGIDLYNAHSHRFERNSISDMHDGIYLENSDDIAVIGNRFERSRYGVHCMYTKRTVIQDNYGTFNVTGAMVMAVREVEVVGNHFAKQRENVHSQGILLFDAERVNVKDNRVEGNRVGIYVEESSHNVISGNEVIGNFIGIQLLNARQNEIRHNAFSGNVADAEAKGSEGNDVNENYWDSFQGIDEDGDGASDLAYAMNPFFQGLIKKRPAFQLFFQAPGMVYMEGLYQADRSSWMTDASPLMQPISGTGQQERSSGTATWITGIVLLALSVSILLYAGVRRSW